MNYWNPYLETLPRKTLDQIELSYFRKIFSYAREHSALYQEKLKGMEEREIQSLEDLKKIPLTEKEEMRKYQEMEPFPYGGLLGRDIREVTTFRQTSGTTGKPIYVPETYESWQWRIEAWCHILYMAGFRPHHRVFLPFGYNVYVAFWEAHYASEKLGCEVIPGGALDTRGRIHKILEIRANAMMNTPTYGLHIAEEARNMGIDPATLGIERMLCAGEPMPTATRKRLEELFHCHVFDHIGGTEPCGWAGMCEAKEGLHIIEPFFLVEVLDRETLRHEVGEGEIGVAVVTPLGRRSFPLIRFNTKDLVVKGKSSCSCGRTTQKIKEVAGRIDDLRKIRGVLFSPKTVEEVIRQEFREVEEFEIVVERRGIMDVITLRAEVNPQLPIGSIEQTNARLRESLKIATNLSFHVIMEPPGSLPRYTLKAKRFKDLRDGNPQ
ncbi:MAG TPA: AMP-binding protein [Thermodesulfobacteriota bacterium]|nr:AMP-binding protein [Thermodesulfobacteriota bacterium]